MPYSNMEAMTAYLQSISNATPAGKHSIVIMNGASWHQYYSKSDNYLCIYAC